MKRLQSARVPVDGSIRIASGYSGTVSPELLPLFGPWRGDERNEQETGYFAASQVTFGFMSVNVPCGLSRQAQTCNS